MLLFVRHASTDFTQLNMIQTHTDTDILPINPELKSRFYSTFKHLLKVDIIDPQLYIIHSSPKTRAMSTAIHLGFQPQVMKDLDELNLGMYDGIQKTDFHNLMSELNPMYDGDDTVHQITIETREQIHERIRNYLHYVYQVEQRYKHTIVFTHGLWIKCCMEYVMNAKINFENLFRNIIIRPLGIVKMDYNTDNRLKIGGIYNE